MGPAIRGRFSGRDTPRARLRLDLTKSPPPRHDGKDVASIRRRGPNQNFTPNVMRKVRGTPVMLPIGLKSPPVTRPFAPVVSVTSTRLCSLVTLRASTRKYIAAKFPISRSLVICRSSDLYPSVESGSYARAVQGAPFSKKAGARRQLIRLRGVGVASVSLPAKVRP